MAYVHEKDCRHREDLRIVKTREAFEAALIRLLETTEYPKITVTALANEARVNRKTFYLHYDTIDDLAEQIIRDNVAEIVDTVSVRMTPETVHEWLRDFTRLALDRIVELPLIRKDSDQRVLLDRVLGIVESALAELAKRECERQGLGNVPNIEYWIAFYLGGVCSAYKQFEQTGEPSNYEEFADMLAAVASRGINAILEDAGTR